MSKPPVKFHSPSDPMGPAQINKAWILQGNPITSNRLLSSSADGSASTYFWDCTAGRFNWYYDVDETVYVIEGSVVVRDHQIGSPRTLRAGDSAFFPAGSSAEWTVDKYVRKIAFLRSPLPKAMVLMQRAKRLLKQALKPSQSKAEQESAPSL